MVQPQLETFRHHTYADDVTWPAGERYELIDGIAYARVPAPVGILPGIVIDWARVVDTPPATAGA